MTRASGTKKGRRDPGWSPGELVGVTETPIYVESTPTETPTHWNSSRKWKDSESPE